MKAHHCVGFFLAESVFKADVAFSFFHFAIAVRTKVLIFAVDLPGVVVPLKPYAAYIATPWFEKVNEKYYYDYTNNPFHHVLQRFCYLSLSR
ncbi:MULTISPECIES: hypothetical protein [Klebsiella/Raoultella group]|uniref:Uncharacterized protein n=2 Tax=Klebsiella pneumoniae TaxID=573 RepID=A0A6G4TNQ5_KLEPN|nr:MULTISPECIES: hypothetical protein [Klebsiella/Raoultella group]UMX53213.1 hypothetical protein MJ389_07060 [Escherichia coli]EKD6430036.1 hypothetical protein [Klebsiella pneumoniae]EKZ9595674.1 hypothetical protein [Klebsiella pneumoniae]ELA2146184.1 hypothetical protein [Klebsiella pneumoniae]MBC4348397.1 hypothetical protein [Klebsiella pneumoniae]